MWSYYFDRDLVTLEVLKLSIEDNISFDAELLELGFNEGQVQTIFDRELTSLEEEEISGYVMYHVSSGYKARGKYQVKKYTDVGSLESVTEYFEKDGDYYKNKVKELKYSYNSDGIATKAVEEVFDYLGKTAKRKKYAIYSDPVTGETMLEEEE